MATINIERIERDITAISQFGFNEDDRGVYRQGFSAADMEARTWLRANVAPVRPLPPRRTAEWGRSCGKKRARHA